MFIRTPSGIGNSHLFYPGDYLVIVEGPQDEPFWSKFFPAEINDYKRRFKPVGGRLEVQNYIDELLSDQAKFAVAIDSDYRFILKCLYQDSRIIETNYYSIENLMVCVPAIASIIRTLSYQTEYEECRVDDWLKHLDEATHSLMVADLINEKNKLGKECVGENCSRFLTKKKKPDFDAQKIDDFIQNLNLCIQDFNEVYEEVEKIKPRFHIRGHFFFSAVQCFITSEVKQIRKSFSTLPNDSLYAMLIMSLGESRIKVDPVLQAMRKQAISAAEEVTNFLSQGT